jgi:hypothetical protein
VEPSARGLFVVEDRVFEASLTGNSLKLHGIDSRLNNGRDPDAADIGHFVHGRRTKARDGG